MVTYKIEVITHGGDTFRYETSQITVALWEIERQHAGKISHIIVRRFKKDEVGTIREVDYQGDFV